MADPAKVRRNYNEFEKLFNKFNDVYPLPAYYIKMHGVMKSLRMLGKNSDPDSEALRQELSAGVGILESMKSNLSNLPEDDKKEVFENFVQSQFTAIDNEERTAEEIKMMHALVFKQVSFLIESLDVIKEDGIGAEWTERRKYCLWKAGDIIKNLKAGVQPRRGNPNVDSGERELPKKPKEETDVPEEGGAQIGMPSGPAMPRASLTKPSEPEVRVLGGVDLAKKHVTNAISNIDF